MSDAQLFPAQSLDLLPRLAAPDPLPEGRRVELARTPARTALTRQTGPQQAWFDWSANPYRGCEFACGYCYARGTHQWLGHDDPRDFQERIYVKDGFVEALRRDLRTRVAPGEHIAFGTATDPYQPIERREGLMRAALREIARASGLRVSITTKSSLVARDVDLIRAVGERNAVQVNMTVTSPDSRLARFLEPKAPAPGVRLGAMRALSAAGIRTGLFLMPVLPGISDGENDLRMLLTAAKESGAQFVAHETVFLEGASRDWFLARLRREYPRVAARYEVWTRTGRSLPSDLRAEVARRVYGLADALGLPTRASPPPKPVAEVQRVFEFVA